jgi:hypothetical protein
MKVQDLITLLSAPDINPDAEVLVWFDGERCALEPALPVDPWSSRYVDLNVITFSELMAANEKEAA